MPTSLPDGTLAGRAGLAAIAADPGRALVAFDFDGVLSPIVEDPQAAQPLLRALTALATLARQVGAAAIITGRPVEFVTSRAGIGDLLTVPGFSIHGQYGRERWEAVVPGRPEDPGGPGMERAGRLEELAGLGGPSQDGIARARTELTRLLRQPGQDERIWLEDKGIALAVHTRRAADPAGALAALREPVSEVARRHQLHLEPGKLVLEIRQPGVHKGDVLRALAAGSGARAVLYAGDDLGDLSAFAVIDELRAGGIPGVKVCSGSPEAAEVAQAADLVVDGPAGIADLLGDLARQIARGPD